jgi:Icc-related predicted phosphoesterase
VLVTHTSEFDTLDLIQKYDRSKRLGCKSLGKRMESLTNLKAHLFGHIHEARGLELINGVIHSNAATTLNIIEI